MDDGARTEDESLRYARRLAAEGVREIVATPHVHRNVALDVHEIGPRVQALQRAIDAERLGVRVHTGGEVHPNRVSALTEAELELVAQGPPGKRWVLLEAPFEGLDSSFSECARELRARGYGILIAHPERAHGVLDDDARRLMDEMGAGSLLQVNVCSLLGQHGLLIQETAVEVLRRGLAFVLASDAHPGTRGHTLRLGFELAVQAGGSSVQAWRLTQANPRTLLRSGITTPAWAPGLAA
jgi:protein-tyrosine phosphatase